MYVILDKVKPCKIKYESLKVGVVQEFDYSADSLQCQSNLIS
jgi:hypothetical protein